MKEFRPATIVFVVGTDTGVGKTWVSSKLIGHWRDSGLIVAARKPAQSFPTRGDSPIRLVRDVDFKYGSDPTVHRVEGTDAHRIGLASGEDPGTVCLPHRWYGSPMAPPMAADALGKSAIKVADLVSELDWGIVPPDVGLLEGVGGVRSPIAHDGDIVDIAVQIRPDHTVVVANARLGVLNQLRLAIDVLVSPSLSGAMGVCHIVLNQFDETSEVQSRNREWLVEQFDELVITSPMSAEGEPDCQKNQKSDISWLAKVLVE